MGTPVNLAVRILFVGGGTLGSVTPLLAVADIFREQCAASVRECGGVSLRWFGTRRGPERVLIAGARILSGPLRNSKFAPEGFRTRLRTSPRSSPYPPDTPRICGDVLARVGILRHRKRVSQRSLFRAIPAGKWRRYWDLRNCTDLFVTAWGFLVTLGALLRWRPDVVVGAGSYVQVPVCAAAWVLRIPIVIHQQDVHLGLANRIIAPFARVVTTVFPESAEAFGSHAQVVGNPVRRAILTARTFDAAEARAQFHLPPEHPTILIVGGGTGSVAMNALVIGALPELLPHANIIHVMGEGKRSASPIPEGARASDGESRNQGSGTAGEYQSFALLTDEMPAAYAAADLVIARAGMGTLTEVVALGKALALIPMPGTHQEENAAVFARAGAAEVWDQRDLTPLAFAHRTLALLRDAARLASLGRAAATVFPTDAAERMAEVVRTVAYGTGVS